MSEFLPKPGEYSPIEDEDLARKMAIATDELITPALDHRNETRAKISHAVNFLAEEHYLRNKEDCEELFPNIEKLLPLSISMTIEEYDDYKAGTREKLLREASGNRGFLLKLLGRTGGVFIDELHVEAAHEIILELNPTYNHMANAYMALPTYQGAYLDPPYSQTDEFRKLHRNGWRRAETERRSAGNR